MGLQKVSYFSATFGSLGHAGATFRAFFWDPGGIFLTFLCLFSPVATTYFLSIFWLSLIFVEILCSQRSSLSVSRAQAPGLAPSQGEVRRTRHSGMTGRTRGEGFLEETCVKNGWVGRAWPGSGLFLGLPVAGFFRIRPNFMGNFPRRAKFLFWGSFSIFCF